MIDINILNSLSSVLLNSSKTMTPGHIQNIPFDTSLNNELRAPKELTPGATISPDKGFAYISENCEDAKLYCKEGKNRTLFEIVVPKGSQISRTGDFGFSMSKRAMSILKSAEAMLPAGAKFEVLAKENIEGLLKLTIKFLK